MTAASTKPLTSQNSTLDLQPQPDTKSKWLMLLISPGFLLFYIMCLAAVLRFYKLGQWSFWGDEYFTVSGKEDGFNYTIIRASISSSLIQHVVSAWGITEWTARLVPALIGVGSVFVLYFPIRRISDQATGLITMLLLAVAPWHIYWSQNARFYVALLLFYTLALLAAYIGLEERRPGYLVAALIFGGLAVKERLLGLFLIPVILGFILITTIKPGGDRGPGEPQPALQARWPYLLLVVGSSLALGVFFVWPYGQNLSTWFSESGFGYANNSPFWLAAGFSFYTGTPIIIMGLAGWVHLYQSRNNLRWLLGLSAIAPIGLLVGISFFHYTANRYAFVSLTSWLFLAGIALRQLIAKLPRQSALLGVAVLLVVLGHALTENFLYFTYQNGNRENWAAAFNLIKLQRQPDDLVITRDPDLGSFYLGEEVMGLQAADVDDLVSADRRVWFIEDIATQAHNSEVHAFFTQEAREIGNFDVQVSARTFTMRVYLLD